MMLGDSIRRRSGRRGRPPTAGGAGMSPGLRLALIAAGLAVAGFLAAYLFATFVIYPPAEALGEAVEVPDVVGLQVDEARERLRNAGLSVAETVPVPDADENEGSIVAQSPLAGQALRPGAGLRLAVSAGAPRLRVPNLLGFEEVAAVAILERAGFHVESSRQIAEEPAGRVARVQPAPGSELAIPATVLLVISTGPPDEVTEDTLPALDGAGAGQGTAGDGSGGADEGPGDAPDEAAARGDRGPGAPR